jgi:hypothetical protein
MRDAGEDGWDLWWSHWRGVVRDVSECGKAEATKLLVRYIARQETALFVEMIRNMIFCAPPYLPVNPAAAKILKRQLQLPRPFASE